MAKAKSWLHRPGKGYLVKCPTVELAPKCTCENARGGWRAQDPDGSLYCFDPPTQLQKDIWLGSVGDGPDKEERIQALRWACFKCGTIQMP